MHCPNCNAPFDEHDATYCGNCGQPISSLSAREVTVLEASRGAQPGTIYHSPTNRGYQGPLPDQSTTAYSPPPAPAAAYNGAPLQQGRFATPPAFLAQAHAASRTRTRSKVFLSIILVLLVVGISAGAFTLLQNNSTLTGKKSTSTNPATSGASTARAAVANLQGQALFVDSQNNLGVPDTVKITVAGLSAPTSGTDYMAWIVNDQSEAILSLGLLSQQDQAVQSTASNPEFALNSVKSGVNLLAAGDKLEITQETGTVSLPTGRVLLSATFPPLAFVHIKHLLVSFPAAPGAVGLLIGLRQQAQAVNTEAQFLNKHTDNKAIVQCAARNILYLIEGKKGADVHQDVQDCPGQNTPINADGFGLLGNNNDGYIPLAATHASLAATQADSTPNIKEHASHVEIAMNNLTSWYTTIEQDARNLANNPGDTQKLSEVVTLAKNAFTGVDANGDGTIDPVSGEAGTITAYTHGELMATLPLTGGA